MEFIALFCIINFLQISSSLTPELIHLSNSAYFLVNEDGIFIFNNIFLNQMEKIGFTEEEQKSSESKENAENTKNIFKVKCFEDNICIFINNYIYILSSYGNIIKKTKISEENIERKYEVFPNHFAIKESNKFSYIILYIDSDGNFVINYYKYNLISDVNTLLINEKIDLFSDKEKGLNVKETDFSCQLISNSIICFFSDEDSQELKIKQFQNNFGRKKNNLLNLLKPEKKLILDGKIMKSFISNDESKILLFYTSKDKIADEIKQKYTIYDINNNKFEFLSEINEFFENNNKKNELGLNSKSNMEYFASIKKYVLYSLNDRNELFIIELNELFEAETKKMFILKNKVEKSTFNLINFSLINHNRNYQIVLLIKNNNNIDNNNNHKSNFIISNLSELSHKITLRKLEENSGNSMGNDNPSGQGTQPGNNEQSGEVEQNQDNEKNDAQSEKQGGEGEEGGSEKGGEGGNQEGGEGGNEEGGKGGEGGVGMGKGERQGQIGGGTFDFDNKNTNISKQEMKENKNSIMQTIEPGQSYELRGDDYSIKIAPMGQREEGATSIDFRECEQRLREYYNLSANSTLSVFQTELTSSNERTLTNKVQYTVYLVDEENSTQLNLSICENQKIQINYQIKNDTNFDIQKFSKFEDIGIDILNSSDPFFNDICYTYTDGSSDVILTDRINEIYQNYSLCDSGCEYEGLNATTGTVSCSCNVTSEDSDDDDDTASNLKSIFLSLFSDSTIGVIQCYKNVFTYSKKSNIGFWIFLVLVIGHIPLYVWFFMKGNSKIKSYIIGEMEKFHYLSRPEEKDNENKISHPPKNSNNDNKSQTPNNRNKESDLIQKSEKLNLVKNTAETEGDEKKSKDELVLKQVHKKEKLENVQNDIEKLAIEQNNTNDSTSKQEANKNQNILTVYKTEETLGENELKLKPKKTTGESKSAYFLIQIDANNSPDNDKPLESNYILNNYEYETAIKYEARTFWRVLYIVMISKDNILNTFILRSPLESKPLQICLLIFSYTCDLALNTLFYFSDNISDKYHYTGKYLFWYTLFNNILISLISTVLSLILGGILNLLSESKDNLEDEFKEEEKKLREDPNYKVSDERKDEIIQKIDKELKNLKVKMVFFVIVDFIILLFFFYFVTAFCEIYKNTQTSWISDAVMSIIISFPIELAIALVITIVYFLSIKFKWKYLYKLAMFFV